ncbi:MAG: GNAT family N-acetyltransferase [Acidobacteriaceae bacterium]|nr:GNAT family N-acetyltransferase [Acidobacteriaceae bacterium]
MTEIVDNVEHHRFEMTLDGALIFLSYELKEKNIVLLHTFVPPSLQGKGAGSKFVHAVLDEVRRRSLRVVPECEFVAAFIKRHPEYEDLIA